MDEETQERVEGKSETEQSPVQSDQETQTAQDSDDQGAEGQGAQDDADKEAEEKVAALEEDPPQDLEEWPDDKAKYKTFGGPEHEQGWDEGPTKNLGDADVRHHDDGSVSVDGEKVDNPDDYKGEPIPGGPTDPNTPSISGEKDLTEDGEGGEDSGDEKSEDDE